MKIDRASSQRAIERGEYQKAIDSFGEVEVAGTGLFSLGASDRMKRRGEALQRRIDLLVSIARVRLAREQMSPAAAAAGYFLESEYWSISDLKKKDPEDPWFRELKADWNALRGGKHRQRALVDLARLESRDLIPDPYGWALLAWMRGLAGDGAGRDRALARCKQMAADPARCDWAIAPAT